MQLPNHIQNKEDFVQFVLDLKNNLQENPDEWENLSLESYLEAIAYWIKSMEHYYKNLQLEPPLEPINWDFFATVLLVGKYYE